MYKEIGEYLNTHGQVIAAPLGSSMRPLLTPDACQVVLVRPAEPPVKYDVVLYRSTKGVLQLHRIVAVTPNGYDIRGDHTYRLERGIPREAILGVMEGFYRKEHYTCVRSKGYRCYVRVWTFMYPLRKIVWLIYQQWKRRCRNE